ncbi:PstS family phosphate ABC transporter substrate-binding protein [Crocosphaera sp. XPORK-15E]|uniref:PstS family phosphate ABC transporter substrate-binding protein n=1 Tax=Crocosphaera sp. XPORK-15E TaxID=3110247 RepID=UPI002B2036E4|nr:PstS family phosphate ABC transporter substrate-binding protein [Crocosphaera sp. XPORK-15E]MEA5536442.1 PstS family phosphate ABC transporter substrate-binding protein [Crocosphaera sp. XPORK-15E]
MNNKKDTQILLLSLLMTSIVLGGAFWGINYFGIWQFSQNKDSQPSDSQVNQNNSEDKTSGTPKDFFRQVNNVPSGLFNYGGSTTWAPIRQQVDSVIQSVYPNFRLRYTDPINGNAGSGTGIKMLLNGQLAFSQSSRSLKSEEYQEAKNKGFNLKEIPVAIDGIAIAVNPNQKTTGLTISQLQDIYVGKIRNWSEVGGENIPIIPYSRRKEAGGTVDFFIENVMNEQEFGANIEYIDTTTQALRKVADNLGGIYYASAPEVVPQCSIKTLPIGVKTDQLIPPYQSPFVPLSQCPKLRNQLNQSGFQSGEYPLTRRLFVIVKENGEDDEKAGLTYAELMLTNQGQTLIKQSGFIPIR